MNISIRKYLLINLLFSVTIVIALTATGNYYLAQKDIQRHLDSLLSQSAFAFQALLSDDLQQRNLLSIQEKINNIHKATDQVFHHVDFHEPAAYHTNFQFQIWNDEGHLLLRSPNSPHSPLSDGSNGYSLATIENVPWRVFTLYNPHTRLSIVVAESLSKRATLGNQIANDYLIIMLFTYPILGFIIWVIIGRGLAPLNRVAYEVSHRVPNFLDPVQMEEVAIEVKPLIEELNRLFTRLSEALDREKRFAGDAAHELKTPLAALKTQAQVALKIREEDALKHSLKNIMAAVDRCTHIVEQLLTLSRLVPEDIATELNDIVSIDLKFLATEVIAELAPAGIAKQLEIELHTSSDETFYIQGNGTSICILVRNLVDNAIRYTPEGGKVTAYIFAENNKVILRVSDTGPGIPVELRSRVFERFFRVLGNSSPGSGLGLAIVQHIVELHHAKITLSAPSEGSGLIIDVSFDRIGNL